ncbi:MAG: hypothetical protein JWM28_1686 [Chitinophagaceae bacterium]|nr:hypothetical protein [Chitinophagaceae bacterium]
MGLVNKVYLALFCIYSFGNLRAQNTAGFFGRKNIVFISSTGYYGDLEKRNPDDISMKGFKKGINLQMSYEHMISTYRMVGAAITANTFVLYDGRQYFEPGTSSQVDLNGQAIGMDFGSGKISISESSAYIYIKRYSRKWHLPPFGFFSSWRFGVSNYNLSLSDDYIFTKAFDNVNYREYKIKQTKIANFKQLNFALELGKTTRLFSDRLMLTYSFILNVPMTFQTGGTDFSKRVISEAKTYINNYKVLQFNMGLGYVL